LLIVISCKSDDDHNTVFPNDYKICWYILSPVIISFHKTTSVYGYCRIRASHRLVWV